MQQTLISAIEKAANLLECEDEQDEWELKQARRNDT
jgi:hypothetical protein